MSPRGVKGLRSVTELRLGDGEIVLVIEHTHGSFQAEGGGSESEKIRMETGE